jgi:peroxin-1
LTINTTTCHGKDKMSDVNVNHLSTIKNSLFRAPYGGGLKDREIGMNATAAKAAGLSEGSLVDCSLIGDVRIIKSLEVTPMTEHDWQILESTSSRIQSTMLDQTKIVYRNQILTVWVNRSVHILLRVDNINPVTSSFGKIENDTELHIVPFKKPAPVSNNSALGISRSSSNKDITELRKKMRERPRSFIDKIDEESPFKSKPPSPQLTNGIGNGVHRKPAESLSRSYHVPAVAPLQKSSTVQTISPREPYQLSKSTSQALPSRTHKSFNDTLTNLKQEASPAIEFRVVAKPWDHTNQLNDIFIAKSNFPASYDIKQVFQLKTRDAKKTFVRIREANSPDGVSNVNILEMNEVLMKTLELQQMERVTLKPRKQPLLNFVEKIQLTPDKQYSQPTHRLIEEKFKQLVLAKSTRHSLKSMLLTQGEVIRLDDYNVTVQLGPDSCEFCLINNELLKTGKICVATEQTKNLDSLLKATEDADKKSGPLKAFIEIESMVSIVGQVVELLKVNFCLDERNQLLHAENIVLQGGFNEGSEL